MGQAVGAIDVQLHPDSHVMQAPPTALLAFHPDPFTLGSGGLTVASVAVAALTQANGGVMFGPGEIAVVGGLLSAVVGAMTLMFRLLLAAKDDAIKYHRERADRWERVAMRSTGLAEVATDTVRTARESVP